MLASSGEVTLRNGDTISFNLKCIVVSLLLALLYWFAPPRTSGSSWPSSTYLALAWHDDLYDCRRRSLKPTILYAFYSPLKPPAHQEDYARWRPSTKRLVLLLLGSRSFSAGGRAARHARPGASHDMMMRLLFRRVR